MLNRSDFPAPALGQQGNLGRNGMRPLRNQSGLGWPIEEMENLQRSSILCIVSPGPATAVVKEVKIDGEWASTPVVATSASSYSICLTTRAIDFERAVPGQGPMHDSEDLAVQHFLYVFSPDGVNTAESELK